MGSSETGAVRPVNGIPDVVVNNGGAMGEAIGSAVGSAVGNAIGNAVHVVGEI